MRKFLLTLAVVGAAIGLAAPSEAASVQATVQPAVFAHPSVTTAHDLVQPVQYRHRRRHRHHRHY